MTDERRYADQLMTPVEAADYYRVSVPTIDHWIGQGLVEAVRLGPRLVRVPRPLVPAPTGAPIDQFGLDGSFQGTRIRNCLLRAGYHTAADLDGIQDSVVAGIPGIGVAALRTLYAAPLGIVWNFHEDDHGVWQGVFGPLDDEEPRQ